MERSDERRATSDGHEPTSSGRVPDRPTSSSPASSLQPPASAVRPLPGSVRVGLYFSESVRAIELAAEGETARGRDEVIEALAPEIPVAGPAAQARGRRIAWAIVRRVIPEHADEVPRPPLHDLVLAAGRSLDTRHLLLYTVAQREPLVLALAEQVFYPRFVLGSMPAGFTEREFNTINTGRLLETDRVVTHRLVEEYARRSWDLDDSASTQCALRILREGGALAATWLARREARCLGYFPSHRGPGWRVFTYALWEEFGSRGRRAVPRAYLRSMTLARLFSLPGPVVDALATRAAAHGFGAIDGRRSGGRLIVAHDSFQEAAAALAESYARGDSD